MGNLRVVARSVDRAVLVLVVCVGNRRQVYRAFLNGGAASSTSELIADGSAIEGGPRHPGQG